MKEKKYKTMSKKRAIEICKNLAGTINNISPSIQKEHEAYEMPRAKKRDLKKIKRKLMEKYCLTKKDLKAWNTQI